tara:strand:- start:39083 stop:39571 length:489 start_codon:yes stop_codon:yes gene_type:complete
LATLAIITLYLLTWAVLLGILFTLAIDTLLVTGTLDTRTGRDTLPFAAEFSGIARHALTWIGLADAIDTDLSGVGATICITRIVDTLPLFTGLKRCTRDFVTGIKTLSIDTSLTRLTRDLLAGLADTAPIFAEQSTGTFTSLTRLNTLSVGALHTWWTEILS